MQELVRVRVRSVSRVSRGGRNRLRQLALRLGERPRREWSARRPHAGVGRGEHHGGAHRRTERIDRRVQSVGGDSREGGGRDGRTSSLADR